MNEHAAAVQTSAEDGQRPVKAAFRRAPAPTSSPFLEAAAGLQLAAADLPTLTDLALAVVQRARLSEPGSLVLLTLPLPRRAEARDPRYDAMVRDGLDVVLMGSEIERHVDSDRTRAHRVPLRPDDPLLREWNVVVCSPGYRLAFLARADEGSRLAGDTAAYRWGVVRDAEQVGAAAALLLTRCPHLPLTLPTLQEPS